MHWVLPCWPIFKACLRSMELLCRSSSTSCNNPCRGTELALVQEFSFSWGLFYFMELPFFHLFTDLCCCCFLFIFWGQVFIQLAARSSSRECSVEQVLGPLSQFAVKKVVCELLVILDLQLVSCMLLLLLSHATTAPVFLLLPALLLISATSQQNSPQSCLHWEKQNGEDNNHS